MKKVNVQPRHNRGEYRGVPIGEIIGYVVDEGLVNGRRKRTTFKTEAEANAYAYKIDVAREAKQVNAVSDLGELMSMRSELMFCWDRLKTAGGTFTNAVDYYLANFRSSKGDITVGDAMVMFKKAKKEQGCSDRYQSSLDIHYSRFLKDFSSTQVMNRINAEDLRSHFYHRRWIEWGAVTRTNYIKNIRALFSFLMKREYLTNNPALKIELPKKKELEIGFLRISEVYSLLNKAIELAWFDRVAVNVLVLFCGIRIEEASKMKWSDISVDRTKVTVGASIAKMSHRRINLIPENARQWLQLVMPKGIARLEPIIKGGWEDKMSILRKKAEIDYPKNAARHSFGTYHFAAYENPVLTAVMMGQPRGTTTLYKHYRNVVDQEEGERYFRIVPNDETLALLKKAPKLNKAVVAESFNKKISSLKKSLSKGKARANTHSLVK